jgi:putative transposase
MTTTKRSAQEAKRLIGGQMLENGCDVDEIVTALDVSKQTVYNWKNKIRNEGVDGLLRKNGSGCPSKLDDIQREKLKQIIRNGAVAYGFPNEQWTGKRVRRVILEQFNIEYNSNYVCALVASLGFSQQLPQVNSINRNQEEINHWKRYVWPQIKKKQGLRTRP